MLRKLMFVMPLLCGLAMPGSAQNCSNASWQGIYYALLQGVVNGSPYMELDKINADGVGGLITNVTANTAGVISQTTVNGSYAVNSDCSGSATPGGTGLSSLSFQLTDGGAVNQIMTLTKNVVVTGKAYRAAPYCNNAVLYGAYGFITANGTSPTAGFANKGQFVFDGVGTYNYSGVENDTGTTTPISGNGTYNLSPDCLGTMSSPPDSKVFALVQGRRLLTLDNDGDFSSDTLEPVYNPVVLGQFAFGGGWYSAVYFTNANKYQVSFAVSFVADDGTPLDVPGTGSSTTVTLPPLATAIIEAPNAGSLTQGYVSTQLPPGVQSYGVFRQQGNTVQEAVAPLSSALTTSVVLTYDETQYVTGIAIVNPGSQSDSVSVSAVDTNGKVVGTGQVLLPPYGKTETTLTNIRGLTGLAGKRGAVTFSAETGTVAVLGLRFNAGAFTSIPTIGN